MKRRNFLLGTATVVGGLGTGAVAFTTASLDRDVNIEIDNDEEAVITLEPNDNFDSVRLDDNGVLEIDISETGLNPDAVFNYEPIFTVTNNASVADTDNYEFTLEYTGDDGVTFEFENGSDSVLLTPGDGEEVNLEVDTDGTSGGDTISGTLTLDATRQ